MILLDHEQLYTHMNTLELNNNIMSIKNKYLNQLCGNYMSFNLIDAKSRVSIYYSSNTEWQKSFIEFNLINHCPLYATSIMMTKNGGSSNFYFLWKHVIPDGKKQRDVSGIRIEHGVSNGLTLAKFTKEKRMFLGLASDPKDHELERNHGILMPKIITLFEEACMACV